MAGKIQLLSDEVIGKIAAGEVVERPSAAIKEMVENSLDAGATAVTVEIRDGGISYFRVTDNGSGIQQSEIRMAFERHATSKITSAQELTAIQTLGFRGEALASIAAVAKVSCTTRTRDDSSGVKVINNGGRIEAIEEAACPEGTRLILQYPGTLEIPQETGNRSWICVRSDDASDTFTSGCLLPIYQPREDTVSFCG